MRQPFASLIWPRIGCPGLWPARRARIATKLQNGTANLYDADFYAWAEEQAARLRAGQFDALDLDNLIEEIQGLADNKLSAVLNSARVVMEHLLKLEHSPATDPPNSWRASVRGHRRRVQTDLSPRIEQILSDEWARFYAMAREDAAAGMCDHEEQAAAEALPMICPYTLDQITGDWWPAVAAPTTKRPVP